MEIIIENEPRPNVKEFINQILAPLENYTSKTNHKIRITITKSFIEITNKIFREKQGSKTKLQNGRDIQYNAVVIPYLETNQPVIHMVVNLTSVESEFRQNKINLFLILTHEKYHIYDYLDIIDQIGLEKFNQDNLSSKFNSLIQEYYAEKCMIIEYKETEEYQNNKNALYQRYIDNYQSFIVTFKLFKNRELEKNNEDLIAKLFQSLSYVIAHESDSYEIPQMFDEISDALKTNFKIQKNNKNYYKTDYLEQKKKIIPLIEKLLLFR